MSILDSLQEHLAELAAGRCELQAAKDKLAEARQCWEKEHADETEHITWVANAVAEVEDTVRKVALTHYEYLGIKQPTVGVTIRVMTRLDYSEPEALSWAKEHNLALALDKRTFEKLAKVEPPAFVTVREEATVAIAADLSGLLRRQKE